jgi:hypothetical protein
MALQAVKHLQEYVDAKTDIMEEELQSVQQEAAAFSNALGTVQRMLSSHKTHVCLTLCCPAT